MNRFLAALAALFLLAWAGPAPAQFGLLGVCCAPTGPASSTWDFVTNLDAANLSSSNGGLTVTKAASDNTVSYIIGTKPIPAAAITYFELNADNAPINGSFSARLMRLGVAHNLTDCPGHTHVNLGGDSCSVGVAATCWGADSSCTTTPSNLFYNFNTSADTGVDFNSTTKARLGWVVDTIHEKLWVTNNGTNFWPGTTTGAGDGNPCTNTGGLNIHTILVDGALYPAATLVTVADPSSERATYVPLAANFTFTKPSCATAIG